MSNGPSLQATAAGLLSGLVGFASSFAVVLAGLTAVGASPAEAASGLMALCFGMGLTGIILSLRLRMPISVAWSTPGAALLAATGSTAGFGAAIGAFLLSGALIVLAGLWKPLGRAIGAIPPPLANAMLAGVLFSLCLAPVRAVAATPAAGLSIILVWVLVARFARLWAVPAAVLTAIVAIAATAPPAAGAAAWQWPMLILPRFDPGVLVGLGLPLFIVTMASQNLPGLAVLAANGYRPDPLPLLRGTGIASLLAAPFGAHAINLAAITAAMCAGPDAHPDPRRRWWAGVVGGLTYCAFGLLAGPAASLAAAAPPLLVQAVAGLALLGALGNSLHACLDGREAREAALICFLVAASGVSAFGIGGAFWGLVAGGLVLGLARFGR
ncbi:benzoate membrane transport protein [Humitalea rosea]|uniref:Benzoate membrane transport protein n=1 Tax=Humitalea rosea TaxID=990373 RepID=A0A2W7KLG5_9PROT|nr:benzoate/H(+) symporter BenE family transporter [Humitalea rosea]PZW49158.1 benzoate membrane transport protein [Humitalea rosea]